MAKCEKRCFANFNGECTVEQCGGPITRVAHTVEFRSAEEAANFYTMARKMFDTYFGKGDETL